MDAGSPFTTFELTVDTDTPGWENTMIKLLKGIQGANFSIHANGVARVSGYIDPATTLKLVAKAGKHAKIRWIDSGRRTTQAQPSEKRVYYHNFDVDPRRSYWQTNNHQYQHSEDPRGSHWQTNNNQYHQQPYPLPPLPPPQYIPPYPPSAPEYYGGEASQCMIM